VTRDTTINGTKYFIDSYGSYFGYKTDGAYFYEKNNNREVQYFKSPANVNDTYTIDPAGPFCAPNISIGVKNTDTTYTYNSVTYDKLIYYLFNYTIQTCQGTGGSGRYLYSTKIGLYVYNRQANNNSTAYTTVVLKSFTF
jgi:VCBS repeat-containing protein